MDERVKSIHWSFEAGSDLDEIFDFYMEHSPENAAENILSLISETEEVIFTKQWQVDEFDPTCRRIIVKRKFFYSKNGRTKDVLELSIDGKNVSAAKTFLYKNFKIPTVDFNLLLSMQKENLTNYLSRIFNVEDYETYSIDVDFNMPQLAQNKFGEITEHVENECPISKAFGIDNGLAEGVVWSVEYKDSVHRFKVKGDKHSVTKVKKLASVDVEKLKTIQDFISYAVTENRFNQAVENVFGKEDLDVKKMGDFIRWFVKDIASEEMDTMVENGKPVGLALRAIST